ncbi:MAG: hypothetical protein IJL78_07185 [Lachnospiraceae bacterium]|nr:hypothetical protein [Lachnospiraceae bacterium]
MKHYGFEEEPYGRAYLESRGRSTEERMALASYEAAKYLPIDFPENCLLPTVNFVPENGAVGHTFGCGIMYFPEKAEEILEKHPEHREELSEIYEIMKKENTDAMYNAAIPPRYIHIARTHLLWGGGWGGHANPDYDRLLHLGTDGIRELIEECRKTHPESAKFYDACRISMDMVDLLGDRVSEKALALSEETDDSERKAEFRRIAETFRIVPRKPAYDMYSAIMEFWMVYTMDGVDSPGRFDQFMYDYYRASSKEENEEMITRFLEAMHNVRGWNLCLSGSDENWNDETNDLSYLVLEKVTELRYNTPNLTVRVHRNTPERLLRACAESLGTGTGLPALYNDEVVCPALEDIGIPPADSHDYCMNGCNQIDIMGKSHMGLEDGEVNLGKVLSLTLFTGYDLSSGEPEMMLPPFGDPAECEDFDSFLALYYRYLDKCTDIAVEMSNISQQMFAEFYPDPYRSCLIQGCLEKGKDYKCGGPLYGDGQVLAEGVADAGDSLYAIKKLIFDSRKYTMDELTEALRDDYKGHDALYKDFSACEKFGNDIKEVDSLTAQVVDHFFRYLKTKRTFRGGVFTGGCSPFVRAAENGAAVAALPNGKHCCESMYADSIAATPGNDKNGPTASVKSMLNYDQTQACSGFVAQMKFSQGLFNTAKGRDSFLDLVRAYFGNGGQQLSINVVDRETLLKAYKEPEKYGNLIVRVGGYSDYFLNLTPELRENVIQRTEF